MSLSRVYMCVIEVGRGFPLSLDVYTNELVGDSEGGGVWVYPWNPVSIVSDQSAALRPKENDLERFGISGHKYSSWHIQEKSLDKSNFWEEKEADRDRLDSLITDTHTFSVYVSLSFVGVYERERGGFPLFLNDYPLNATWDLE